MARQSRNPGLLPPSMDQSVRARFFELSNHGLIVLASDDDGRSFKILDANVSAARLLGFNSRDDVIGLSTAEALVHGDEWDRLKREWNPRLLSRESPFESQIRVTRADGTTGLLECIAIYAKADGAPLIYLDLSDSSARPNIHDELAASDARFRALMSHPSLGMMIRAGENILYANQAYAHIFGYEDPEQVIAVAKVTALEAEHERARLDSYRRDRLMGRPVPDSYEFQGVRKDGSFIWLENRVVETVWDGRKSHVTIVVDVSERRRMEEALESSERHFRTLADTSFEGMTVVQDNRIVFATYAAASFLGYVGPDELVRFESLDDLVYPEDRAITDRNRNLRMSGQDAPNSYEFRLLHKDGSPRWIENRATVFDWDGAPAVFSIYADISQRKQAEEDLEKSRERLTNAQRIASVGSWNWDVVADTLAWSDEIYRLMGMEPSDMEPNAGAFFDRVHPDDRKIVSAAIRSTLEEGAEYAFDHRLVLSDGSIRHVHEDAEVLYDEHGQPTILSGTMQDITLRKEMEEALLIAKEDAESANRAKSEFLSSMSHELRNPLNAILGFGQLLAWDSTDPLTKAQKVAVEQILMGGDHLLKLIANILDLARIESGNLMTVIEGVDVREIVEETLDLASGLATSSGISLHNGCQGNSVRMPLVRADRTRLRQVLLNFVTNGIKYNAEGGFVIVTGEQRGNAMFRLSVTDTGYGIAKELTSRLFIPFDRLGAEFSATEGTGIGLTISKQLMDLMNGKIGFETEVGKGSTFWLEIPLAPQDMTQSAKEAPPRAAAPTQQETAAVKQFRVLYIEDSASNVALMHGIVETVADAMMVSAHTAKLGLELATAMRPDLVLMDLNLPEIDGFEALIRLRSNSRFRDIPVIAITADATAKTEERCRLAGFEGFLTKPIDINEVVRLITRRIHHISDTRDHAEDR